MSTKQLEPTERTTLHRRAQRGSFDREVIWGILDDARLCHVAFIDGEQPFVLPTAYARIGDWLYVHGSRSNRMLTILSDGAPACVTVTITDGLVLARSAFHHSMNYRSVVILGTARQVNDPPEKSAAMFALIDHIVPGRSKETRMPSAEELGATTILAFPILEASAKIRRGPPVDDAEDHARDIWAGEIPLVEIARPPISAPDLRAGIDVAHSALAYVKTKAP